MSITSCSNFRVSILLLLYTVAILICFPELLLSAVVTLDSLEIYKTHEWLSSKPTVYFKCNGENKTVLPDVKKTHTTYNFKGEESWQPLTEFPSKKCKRCGFYEEDQIKSDDVFDEWEFCPSDFTAPDGTYIRTSDKEFNATFLCKDCVQPVKKEEPVSSSKSDNASPPHEEEKGMHWAIIVVISVVASTVFVSGLVVAYRYWQKKKRQQEQARFLKLFEDGDDIEDELGIGPLSDSI